MSRQLIGLVGYAQSGKDTAAEGLIAEGWKRVSFADPLRELALQVNPIMWSADFLCHMPLRNLVKHSGWTEAKMSPEVREFLQNLGTGCRETFGPDCWVQQAVRKINQSHRNVVVTDCRFPNEFDAIKEMGGALVRVTRPGVGPVNSHESDSYVDDVTVRAVISNSGSTLDLQSSLAFVVKQLSLGDRKDCLAG